MDFDFLIEVLFPQYIDHRTLLRLGSCNIRLWSLILSNDGFLWKYFAQTKCKTQWKKVSCENISQLAHKPTEPTTYATAIVRFKTVRTKQFAMVPKIPSVLVTKQEIMHKLCRECFQPTTSRALTKSGIRVLVCKSCSKESGNYSQLYTRDNIISMNKQRKWRIKSRTINDFIKTLRMAKIGGNQCHLFWKHEITHFFKDRS
jgi:hypothetical protein